jgi:stage II sporulation protein D
MKILFHKKSILFFSVVLVLFAAIPAGCGKTHTKPDNSSKSVHLYSEPEISVFMHETNEIKSMKMEEYIAGVVAGEMNVNWPIEALAAQAIIARTFTVEAIETRGGVPSREADASTDINEFQAYNAAIVNDAVQKAVDMTRGLIITYENNPAKTWFHSSAGGMTAYAKEGLNYRHGEPPYIRPVKSPDDIAPDNIKHWQAVFSKGDVLKALNKHGITIDKLETLEISEKGQSGRVVSLLVNRSIKVSGPDFRVSLDSIKLKSMLLDKITISGDNVTFSGRGYGHGVGMSQWGAHQLAKGGKTHEEIILHYFKNVTVEKRWH